MSYFSDMLGMSEEDYETGVEAEIAAMPKFSDETRVVEFTTVDVTTGLSTIMAADFQFAGYDQEAHSAIFVRASRTPSQTRAIAEEKFQQEQAAKQLEEATTTPELATAFDE